MNWVMNWAIQGGPMQVLGDEAPYGDKHNVGNR